MSVIIFNAVLKIEDELLEGLWRVVAVPQDADIFLYRLPMSKNENQVVDIKMPTLTRIATATMEAIEKAGNVRKINIEPESRLCTPSTKLKESDKKIFERREQIMRRFLDHEELCYALTSPRGLGGLVAAARVETGCSRSTVYRYFELLCTHGFEAGSLIPRSDLVGAPGVPRPFSGGKKVGRKTDKERLGIAEEHPQQGMTEKNKIKFFAAYSRMKNPKPSFPKLYDQLIEDIYVDKYLQTPDGLKPVMPLQGTFPNKRQMRYIIETYVKKIDRAKSKTTGGHFERNKRGMVGHAWEGVAGPGHVYAIDSTIGDIFLRSSINRAWFIGRPIVYLIVDVWSTAIVGFYVCLTGPSWATAKVALFSAFSDPTLLGNIWGYHPLMVLSPNPTAPYVFLCDRGEYLGAGARETGKVLGINFEFNPSCRPDLKGLVEVLNRIAKDQQFYFLPGAIDARRKELELKTDIRASAYTLREYVQFLHTIFNHYNLFADRRHRLTSEMIAAGVQPFPAGLWRYGHQVGIGYRKELSQTRLTTSLLPEKEVVVNRKGIYLGQIEYEFPRAREEQWTAIARNYGADHHSVYVFPGSNSKVWWPDPKNGGMHEFTLSPNARVQADICYDEWLDAYACSKIAKNDLEFQRLSSSIASMAQVNELTRRAVELTKQAEADYQGPIPAIREARSMESYTGCTPDATSPIVAQPEQTADAAAAAYDELMKKVFADASRQQKGGDHAC